MFVGVRGPRAWWWIVGCSLLSATMAAAVVSHDCADPMAPCTLAETARQAHVHVGVATSGSHGPVHQSLIAEHFTAVTTENAMKWGEIAPAVGVYDFAAADAIVSFAQTHGLRLRGHTMFWGRLQLPSDLAADVQSAPDPAARLRAHMTTHVETMATRYGATVDLWDVVNEPYEELTPTLDDNLFAVTLGPGWVDEAVGLMRGALPNATLVLNEFVLVYPSAKIGAMAALASQTGVDAIGIQGHFFPFFPLPTPEAFGEALAALATAGVPIEITELDVSLWHFRAHADPLAAQAAYFGAITAACMSVPACQGLTMWGLSDDETWLDGFAPFNTAAPNRPLLFDEALTPKPAYFAMRDAVRSRAVPFHEQARTLRVYLAVARRSGTIRGTSLRTVARGLRNARRHARRGRFADACDALQGAAVAVGTASGTSVAPLTDRIDALRNDLDCPAIP